MKEFFVGRGFTSLLVLACFIIALIKDTELEWLSYIGFIISLIFFRLSEVIDKIEENGKHNKPS